MVSATPFLGFRCCSTSPQSINRLSSDVPGSGREEQEVIKAVKADKPIMIMVLNFISNPFKGTTVYLIVSCAVFFVNYGLFYCPKLSSNPGEGKLYFEKSPGWLLYEKQKILT